MYDPTVARLTYRGLLGRRRALILGALPVLLIVISAVVRFLTGADDQVAADVLGGFALATMVPSASRTTMSRMRSDVRPFASRSICVPPISTSWPAPKFSLIAAVSHGVAMSSSIGPLESRHQSATIVTRTRPQSEPPMTTNLRIRGPHSRSPISRESGHVRRVAGRIL